MSDLHIQLIDKVYEELEESNLLSPEVEEMIEGYNLGQLIILLFQLSKASAVKTAKNPLSRKLIESKNGQLRFDA